MQCSAYKFYVVTSAEASWNDNLQSRLISWLCERHTSFSEVRFSDLSQKYHEAEIAKYFEQHILAKINFSTPDNLYIHLSSTLLFTKLRLMVKERKIKPFTILVVNRNKVQEIHVDSDGRMDKCLKGVFDAMDDLLSALLSTTHRL